MPPSHLLPPAVRFCARHASSLPLGQRCPGTESASLVRHGLLLIGPGGPKEGGEEEARATYQDAAKKAKKGMDTVNCSQRHWGMA